MNVSKIKAILKYKDIFVVLFLKVSRSHNKHLLFLQCRRIKIDDLRVKIYVDSFRFENQLISERNSIIIKNMKK